MRAATPAVAAPPTPSRFVCLLWPDGAAAWVLLGPDESPVGRAPQRFDSLDECLTALARLRGASGRARVAVREDNGWDVTADGEVLATSPDVAPGVAEAQSRAALFLALVPTSLVDADLGRRGTHGPSQQVDGLRPPRATRTRTAS